MQLTRGIWGVAPARGVAVAASLESEAVSPASTLLTLCNFWEGSAASQLAQRAAAALPNPLATYRS